MKKAAVAIAIALVAIAGIASIAYFQLDKIAEEQKKREATVEYAKSIEDEVKRTLNPFTKLTQSQASDISAEPFVQISADAKTSIQALRSMKTPSKGKALKADSIELVALVGETSANIAAAITYASLVESATGRLNANTSSSPESLSVYAKDIRSSQKRVKVAITRLKKAKPPAAYEGFHSKFVALLQDFSQATDEVASAAELNKYESVLRSIEDMDKVAKRSSALRAPTKYTALSDAFPASSREQLKALMRRVDSGIAKLNPEYR